MTSLKMCVSLITSLIKLEMIRRLVFSNMYGRPEIFKYDLDLERQELSMWFELMLLFSLRYFLIILISETNEVLLVLMMISLFLTWMNLAMVTNLAFLRCPLILAMWVLAKLPMILELYVFIRIIICFLDRLLVVMLILGFFKPTLLLLTMSLISMTFLVGSFRKVSIFNVNNIFHITSWSLYIRFFKVIYVFAKFQLGPEGIEGRILETSIDLLFVAVGKIIILLLN